MIMTRNQIVFTIATIASLSILVGYLAASNDSLIDENPLNPASISEYQFEKKSSSQWALPKLLREISGIAVVDNQRLLIHQDETVVVYLFDVDTQLVTPLFQLGEPALKRDIEGIALLQSDVYLITSTGAIYKVTDGLNRSGVIEDYVVFDTGLADVCEIEGLDEDLTKGSLVLACKQMFVKDADYISVYQFTPETNQTARLFDISFADIGQPVRATAITTRFDHYIVLFGKKNLLAQIAENGSVVGIQSLKKKLHPQSEGLGFLEDGRLVLADEGKKGRGRITVYRPMNDKHL
jgi:hypothetical protein